MKKQLTKHILIYLSCIGLFNVVSCKKESIITPVESAKAAKTIKLSTQSITPPTFNWETVDWMPTPPLQSLIPPPWIGQGSISSTYGADVISDHKAVDGWSLVYNTFDPNSPGPLVNPYFILYNKYRGLMRVYLYTTTQFVTPSTYVVDGISIVSNSSTSMLNFLGDDLIDPTQNKSKFSQIEPAPIDGSQPLASNKWYMMQYEIAYDPAITALTSDNIQLSWFVNYNSISTISLGGTETGTLKTPTGASGNGVSTALQNAGTTVGSATLAVVGQGVLTATGDANTGANSIGLPNNTFRDIAKGIASTVSALTGGIPAAVYGIFNAIIGGNSSSPTINAAFNSTIKLDGTQTSSGSFPSSPTSVYLPGTNILPSAQNYIPLYNQPLGVFNLTGKPTVRISSYLLHHSNGFNSTNLDFSLNTDDAYQYLVTNPAVINDTPTGATILRVTMEPIALDPPSLAIVPGAGRVDQIAGRTVLVSTGDLTDTYVTFKTEDYNLNHTLLPTDRVGVRVVITLRPNSGPQQPVTIIKTFLANKDVVYL